MPFAVGGGSASWCGTSIGGRQSERVAASTVTAGRRARPGLLKAHSSPSTNNFADAPPPPPNIADLAEMARLDVSADEAAVWGPTINGIVDWLGQLRAAPLDDVPPADAAENGGSIGAPDEPVVFPGRETLLAQAPSRDGPYLRLPKVL